MFCRNAREADLLDNIVVQPAYEARRPITDAKYKDLATLCRKNIILPEYHSEYTELPHVAGRDRLPEPDINEDDGDDDA